MYLAAALRLAEETGQLHENTIPGEPLYYGVGAFLALVLLLWIVTRFNADR
jgi:hypothetical protein